MLRVYAHVISKNDIAFVIKNAGRPIAKIFIFN